MIFPSLEETIAVDLGTSTCVTCTPTSLKEPSAARRSEATRAGTGGIVLFAIRAASLVTSE